jgi:Asp/Glu/hydantoin racemase
MKYHRKKGQVSYGEAIGIILLDSEAPFVPGDVANATTYRFPVRFQRVEGLTVQKMMDHDKSSLDKVIEAAELLKKEGVRAITSDCGFMALYQKELRERLDIPVFLSSLLQIPFIGEIIPYGKKIGVITANGKSLTEDVIRMCGIDKLDNLVITGLEEEPNFSSAFLIEEGFVDTDEVEREVVGKALQLKKENPDIGAILLECSVLPPYAEAVQRATGLPVFDFVTMINYVFSAVVRESGRGFM